MPTISEKPWSDYTKADYTPEQWHAACLIHLHTGPPTSKDQCKLPVKTPNGALNRAGVHAAAAALAGARGGVTASPGQRAAASVALVGYYRQLQETPPDSLTHEEASKVKDFIAHYGRKGMKWGRHIFTKESGGGGKSSGGDKKSESDGEGDGHTRLSADAERLVKTTQKSSHEMSDREIKEANNRAEAIKKYNQLFNDPNGELKAKVEQLRLKKEFAQMQRELNPTKMQRVNKFLNDANKAFETFDKIDKLSNRQVSGKMKGFYSKNFKTSPNVKVHVPNFTSGSPGGKRRTSNSSQTFKITSLGP